jgi:hypothetical protein
MAGREAPGPDQLTIDVGPVPRARRVDPAPSVTGFGAAGWSKYRPKNAEKCDHCLLAMRNAPLTAPAARKARWRRRVGFSPITDLLLCDEHAQDQRDADHLPAIPDKELTQPWRSST